MIPRLLLLVLLFPAGIAVHAEAAHDLPVCTDFPAPGADWARTEEGGFAFALPPAASARPRGPSLDHEFGQWTWEDGRQLQFQYGFAVTELAGWLDESFVAGCRADLDGVDAVFLERRNPDGTFVWAVGLFDYVRSYTAGDMPGQSNPTLANDLALIGSGTSEAVFAQGRAVFGSFRWSRIPASSLAAWSVQGASNNGVLVFETEKGATALMFATYRDGKPYWLVGVPPGPVMSYRQGKTPFGQDEVATVSVPLVLYETANGVVPGEADHPAQIAYFADAELTVSLDDRCERARLRYAHRDAGAIVTLALLPTYPLLHGCSPYRSGN